MGTAGAAMRRRKLFNGNPEEQVGGEAVPRYQAACDRARVILRPLESPLKPLCDTQKGPYLL
jgi:hypothetical protein